MEEHRRYGLGNQIDMEQILSEAQNRWLRPAEICEILRNYRKFRIAPEPPDKPPSGSLFLFDRKVLRYFRKDGHNWRKKKDGKTVREAHERLKVGSIDMLHCYYAHGEENENFQRRSYWMLEEDFMHIVLVHYREVKGNNMRFGCVRDAERVISSSQMDSPVSSGFLTSHDQASSPTTDTTSLNSVHTSEYEDAESVNHQASSASHSILEVQPREGRSLMNKTDAGLFDSYYPVPYPNDYQGKQLPSPELKFLSLLQENISTDNTDAGFEFTSGSGKQLDLTSWEEVLESCTTGFQVSSFPPSIPFTPYSTIETIPKRENILEQLFLDELNVKQEVVGHMQNQEMLQHNGYPVQNGYQMQQLDAEQDCILKPNSEQDLGLEGNFNYSSNVKPPLLDCSKTDLKKLDSFNRWMSKELGEVEESHMPSSSRFYWNSVDTEDVGDESSMSSHVHLDPYLLSPSLSQDQLFSIIDFSPAWAYTDSETKVLVTGIFLKNQQDAAKCKWSCMFGEIEVLAEVLADGILCCQAPPHTSGRVPFYVTCSNRLACSEVREFEYRVSHDQDMDNKDPCIGNTIDMLLHIRLGKLLSLGYVNQSPSSNANEKSHINSKINSLMKEEDEWLQVVKFTSEEEFSPGKVKEQLLQELLKEKLRVWLFHKTAEDGKGPSVLDKKGQGVLHLAAALGYDWAIEPTVTAGVSINFRDVNGWTALHWAAFCGRERTVVALVHLGAAPGALTDPTPKFPSGRAPADLASINGHKGIAGYLAESSLTSHLSSLTLKDKKVIDGPALHEGNAVQTVTERSAIPYTYGDAPDELSLKDSLTAVRNASQAAARIHQVFRVQSFQKKQLIEYGDDKFGMSDERALSLISVKTHRPGLHNEPMHAAAIRIQNKFRGWKGRKEFLIIRQRIVKIQAHVRGHQVRKHYRKFTWSVGIVEKAILRWRRKGSGLRGFRVDAMIEGSTSKSDDDYDFLKEGKKQTEERLQKALARVQSMVQYPEARDQYRRLLNVVSELKESKVLNGGVPEETGYVDDEDLIDLEALLDDDNFMSTAF